MKYFNIPMTLIIIINITHLYSQEPIDVTNFNSIKAAVVYNNNCFLVTDNQTEYVKGAVWYKTKINLNHFFSITFHASFGNLGADGADGIAFVLQNDTRVEEFEPGKFQSTAIGERGGAIGIGWHQQPIEPRISPSFSIEFDTYYNGWDQGEFAYSDCSRDGSRWGEVDHIAFVENGMQGNPLPGDFGNMNSPNRNTVPALPNNDEIEDGNDHSITITWEPNNKTLCVFFDNIFRNSIAIDLIEKFKRNSQGEIIQEEPIVWWGITSANGDCNNNHLTCFDSYYKCKIDLIPELDICYGDKIKIEPTYYGTDLINAVYKWEPALGIDNPNSANPIVSPRTTTEYTVTMTTTNGCIA